MDVKLIKSQDDICSWFIRISWSIDKPNSVRNKNGSSLCHINRPSDGQCTRCTMWSENSLKRNQFPYSSVFVTANRDFHITWQIKCKHLTFLLEIAIKSDINFMRKVNTASVCIAWSPAKSKFIFYDLELRNFGANKKWHTQIHIDLHWTGTKTITGEPDAIAKKLLWLLFFNFCSPFRACVAIPLRTTERMRKILYDFPRKINSRTSATIFITFRQFNKHIFRINGDWVSFIR